MHSDPMNCFALLSISSPCTVKQCSAQFIDMSINFVATKIVFVLLLLIRLPTPLFSVLLHNFCGFYICVRHIMKMANVTKINCALFKVSN